MPVVIPLAEIFTLLAAFLILWAAYALFHGVLNGLISRVPFIGGPLSQLISAVLGDAIAWTDTTFHNVLSGLWGLLMTPVHWISSIIEAFVFQIYNLVLTVRQLAVFVIPDLRLSLEALAAGDLNLAEQYAAHLFGQAYSALQAGLSQVYAYFGAQIAGVYRYVNTEIATVETYVGVELGQLSAYVQATDAQLLTYVQAEIASDQAYARALAAEAITYTQSAVSSLTTTVTGDLTGIEDWVGQQVTALQTSIASTLAISEAYTGTLVQTVETELTNLKTECTDNLCANLSPLATLLGDLAGAWSIAALIAAAAEFASDPHAVAGQIQDTVGSAVDGALSLIRDAVGV